MSHAATHWLADVQPKQMTHGEFRVLFHLCDCHNPSMGCFPKQAYLRDHTGLSNGGLNKALAGLEAKGLIRRDKAKDPQTNRQLPTQYVLGFELSDDAEPAPLSGDGAVSTSDAVPSPLFGGSVSTTVESYTKEEPVKEPCAETAQQKIPFPDLVKRFIKAYPAPCDRDRVAQALKNALGAGATAMELIEAAAAYAVQQKGNEPRYIAFAENWLKQDRWKLYAPVHAKATPQDIALVRARAIKECQEWIGRHLSPAQARALIDQELVTEEECRAAGVTL